MRSILFALAMLAAVGIGVGAVWYAEQPATHQTAEGGGGM